MGNKFRTVLLVALPVQLLLVLWSGFHPQWVEDQYSNGLYPLISRGLRELVGWVPFSVGDLLYTLLALLALRYLYRHGRSLPKRPLYYLKDVLAVLSLAYFLFHLCWGMNYYRQPITWKMGIQRDYALPELVAFTRQMAEQANRIQWEIVGDSLSPVRLPYSIREIYGKTEQAYGALSREYPFFNYRSPSIKSSLYSLPLTYMGYSGYLNPFTNEAQVNVRVPLFRLPSISAHEVGHQLGYSAEDATNFIGYLVTSNSRDPYFNYSASTHALGYCLGDLYQRDRAEHAKILASLNPGVRKNYDELRNFWEKYENPMEPLFKTVFNTFLKVNNQKDGIKSYNGVVGLMINHEKQRQARGLEL